VAFIILCTEYRLCVDVYTQNVFTKVMASDCKRLL